MVKLKGAAQGRLLRPDRQRRAVDRSHLSFVICHLSFVICHLSLPAHQCSGNDRWKWLHSSPSSSSSPDTSSASSDFFFLPLPFFSLLKLAAATSSVSKLSIRSRSCVIFNAP